MTEFYYGRTPASMIYYGKQLIYDSTASSPEGPTEYEKVNLYFYPDKKLLNDVIYISDMQDQYFITYEAKKTISGGKECYKATVNTNQFGYIYTNPLLVDPYFGYKTSKEGWSYKLDGNISFSKTKLNNAVYPILSSPVFGTINLRILGNYRIQNFELWDSEGAVQQYDTELVPLDIETLAIYLNGEELEYDPSYRYYATVARDNAEREEIATIEIDPNEDNFITIGNSISNYDENGYYNLIIEITAEPFQREYVELTLISPVILADRSVFVYNTGDVDVYEAISSDGQNFSVTVPSRGQYVISNERPDERRHGYKINEDEGWSYDLFIDNEGKSVDVDGSSHEMEIQLGISTMPDYGCIQINIDEDSEQLLNTWGVSYEYLTPDGGVGFYPLESCPVSEEMLSIEAIIEHGVLDPNYTHQVLINGEEFQVYTDEYYYWPIYPNYDENGYYQVDIVALQTPIYLSGSYTYLPVESTTHFFDTGEHRVDDYVSYIETDDCYFAIGFPTDFSRTAYRIDANTEANIYDDSGYLRTYANAGIIELSPLNDGIDINRWECDEEILYAGLDFYGVACLEGRVLVIDLEGDHSDITEISDGDNIYEITDVWYKEDMGRSYLFSPDWNDSLPDLSKTKFYI